MGYKKELDGKIECFVCYLFAANLIDAKGGSMLPVEAALGGVSNELPREFVDYFNTCMLNKGHCCRNMAYCYPGLSLLLDTTNGQ